MSVADALRQKVTAVTESAKIADLQKDTHKQEAFLTTDHGVKVSETDNWYVFHLRLYVFIAHLFNRLKVQDGVHTGPSLLEDQVWPLKSYHFFFTTDPLTMY